MSTYFSKDNLKTEKPFLLSFSKYPTFPCFSEKCNQLTDTLYLKFNFNQFMRWVKRKVSTNFGKDILKTDQNITHFHLSVNKWTYRRTHRNNPYFGLTNLWHRSRGECPAILVKITWKLKNFSNFLSQNISLFHVSVNKWTNWQTHKQKIEI